MSIRRALFVGIVVCLLLPGTGFAQIGLRHPAGVTIEAGSATPFFLEMWNNLAFYDTNLEKPRFAALLGRFEGKFGLNVFHLPLQVYGTYYGAASQSPDYWNNYLYSGAGVRIVWLPGVNFFYEELGSSYSKNSVSAEGLAKRDTVYGVEIWHEWNLDKPDLRKPWAELWLKLMHRETNFGWEPFRSYVYYLQPKVGIHLNDEIEAYLRADVTGSGKEAPDYYFLNIADYGIGIRFEPMRRVSSANDLFRKFKMYAEILSVAYLKNPPPDTTKNVSSDVRFGVEFTYGR
jgi:hypothetical protein